MRLLFLVVLLLAPTALPALGQRFTAEPALIRTGVPLLGQGSADWGDFDGDGDLDLIVTGLTGPEAPLTRIYELQDSLFTQAVGGYLVSLPFKVFRPIESIVNDVFQGVARWGDLDGDGDDDVLLFGLAYFERNVGEPVLETVGEIYRNNRGILVQTADRLPGLHSGDAAWADIDGDGDLDFGACGASALEAPFAPRTVVYLNDDGVMSEIATDLPGVSGCALDWGDMDGDGDMDLALAGESDQGSVLSVFEFDGVGAFSEIKMDAPRLLFSDVAWSDFDLDGRADLLASGGVLDPFLLRGEAFLWRSSALGFVDATPASLTGVVAGEVDWGDWDVDGRPDIFVSGAVSVLGARSGAILINRDGAFVREYSLAGLTGGGLLVADYNADGDPDLFQFGINEQGTLQNSLLMNRTFPEPLPPGAVRR